MLVAPASAPPIPSHLSTPPQVVSTPGSRTSFSQSGATKCFATTDNTAAFERIENLTNSLSIPSVNLDTERITHTMAATLALSLLGHVLFLKSQVPFPLVQLARMPGGQSDSRAGRRRQDLLSAIDTLTSHLHTSFSALSTALARRNAKGKAKPDTALAHLAFVLGPSVGAARARVMFVVDGLEVKIWGMRDDGLGLSRNTPRSGSGENLAEQNESSNDEDSSDEEEDDDTDDDRQGDDNDTLEESDASDEGSQLSDDSSEPPASRSPSPSPPSSHGDSRCSSPVKCCFTDPPSSAPPTDRVDRPPQPTYAEEQSTLRAAERLLSRTLASACAEDGGMSCELAPTQTHVLLRAPRRFVHPAWQPRQNMTRALDGVLQTFMEESGATDASPTSRGRAKARGVRTEGVWVGRAGQATPAQDATTEDEDEEDEMIWWAWDGKIVGFSDW